MCFQPASASRCCAPTEREPNLGRRAINISPRWGEIPQHQLESANFRTRDGEDPTGRTRVTLFPETHAD